MVARGEASPKSREAIGPSASMGGSKAESRAGDKSDDEAPGRGSAGAFGGSGFGYSRAVTLDMASSKRRT